MKKIFLYLITAMVCLAYTGCKYDDSDLWNEVDGIKDRVEALEQATTSLNNDISALSAIVIHLRLMSQSQLSTKMQPDMK